MSRPGLRDLHILLCAGRVETIRMAVNLFLESIKPVRRFMQCFRMQKILLDLLMASFVYAVSIKTFRILIDLYIYTRERIINILW